VVDVGGYVPNNHNIHYYANITGYNTLRAFVIADSGPHPAALACRTRAALTMGRKYTGELDFGPIDKKVFLGLRYKGEDGQTITLRNLGTLDQKLDLVVTHGDNLEVVDAFGNTQKVEVKDQWATVTVSQFPCYLRLAKEQDVLPVPMPEDNRSRNIASQATFSYSGGTESDPNLLTDGVFQSTFLGSHATTIWSGKYTGKFFNDKPETLDIAFDAPHRIEKLLVFGVHADNPHSALLDYDLQYHDGKDWMTLEEVRTPCPPSDPVRVYHANDGGDALHQGFYSVAYTWFADNNFFVHKLKQPVKTNKLRLVIRRITRGFVPDMIAEDALNADKPAHWKASAETLELREIEIYGDGQSE